MLQQFFITQLKLRLILLFIMNEYVFDEVYGSEAKKIKITQSPNYNYYQTMLKLRGRHANNKTVFNNLFQQPQEATNEPESAYPHKQLIQKSHQKIFSSLQRNNYTIQKINSHVYKILKRKSNRISSNTASVNLKNIENGIFNTPKQDKWMNNIKSDANKIRRYLQSTQTKREYRTLSNFSSEMSRGDKNSSRYSNSGDSVQKNRSFRISSTRF